MKFGSWTYDGTKINLTAKDDSIDMTTYQPSGEWEILGTGIRVKSVCCDSSAYRPIGRYRRSKHRKLLTSLNI